MAEEFKKVTLVNKSGDKAVADSPTSYQSLRWNGYVEEKDASVAFGKKDEPKQAAQQKPADQQPKQ